MRRILFENNALNDFTNWASENKKVFDKITKLLDEIRRTPFTGTGKPEALKHNLKGLWSRRITDEHRLIYKITDDLIIVTACREHY